LRILLAAGEVGLGMGSLLLFATNYFAILLTGAFVFGLMGYPQASMVDRTSRARRIAIYVVVAMVLLIAAPLGLQTARIVRDHVSETRTATAVKTWLEGSEYKYVSSNAEDKVVSVVILGQGDLPPESQLYEELAGKIYGKQVQLEVLPSQSLGFDTN